MIAVQPIQAQFVDEFDNVLSAEWTRFTGDGLANVTLSRNPAGFATVSVDATRDTANVWWALIRRNVADALDLERASRPENEIRIEARIRVSHAPRRVNLHVNTQRTTDFHSHLMEYEIDDASGWHTISMTTDRFDIRPGDDLNLQMALIDWGIGLFNLDVDYIRVDVVNGLRSPPDLGSPIAYHPSPPIPASLEYAIEPIDAPDAQRLVSPTTAAEFHWNLRQFAGTEPLGAGLLELVIDPSKTHPGEIGLLRISEIGNPQMIIDVPLSGSADPIYATIPRVVLRRLFTDVERGVAIRSLHGSETAISSAGLRFNLADSMIVPDVSRHEALLFGLARAVAFRQILLRGSPDPGSSRAERLARLIDRFLRSEFVGNQAAGCTVDAILRGLRAVSHRDAVDLMNEFRGEWHGWWDTMPVHHDWSQVLDFDPPVTLGAAGTRVRALQYAWVGDGFGWNIVAEENRSGPGVSDSGSYILGTVFHVEDGDPTTVRFHRPHVGVLCGRGDSIWITDGEVFLEQIVADDRATGGVVYAIVGFDYEWNDDGLVWKTWFETTYGREPGQPNRFRRLTPDPD